MSDTDQATHPRRTPDAGQPAGRFAPSRPALPPGILPGAEVPPLVPGHDVDSDPTPRRLTPAPLRLAAAVTAMAVLGALVIGVSGRSAIGETPPQQPGVGEQVAAAERAGAGDPAARRSHADALDNLSTLVVEVDGAGEAELVVGSALGVVTRQVSLPYRGSVPASGDTAAATTSVQVTATARTPGTPLRCRLFSANRLVTAASSPGRVDCSIRRS